jgi:hypothetical protein
VTECQHPDCPEQYLQHDPLSVCPWCNYDPLTGGFALDPKYEHDCDDCTFVGRLLLPGGSEYDMYTCPQRALEIPTTVLRYGNEPWDYLSGDPLPIRQLGIVIERSKTSERVHHQRDGAS